MKLLPFLTLLTAATMPASRLEKRKQAHAALQACDLEKLADRHPAQLSIGQQQRVAIARALAVRPKLLLLDEPFSGLDITLKDQLFAQLRQLAATHAVTLLIVTHDPLEATALCEHALVIEDGALCERGRFAELLRQPRSATLRAFLRQLPIAS